MEMYFKSVQKLNTNEFIFSSDANSLLYKISGDQTYNDFIYDFAFNPIEQSQDIDDD